MNDLVSVIIPTYKRSQCLIRAINSVLNQTYKNIEIIVVDDNDEDSVYRKENEEKLKKYVELKRIFYIKHKKNLNGANARNSGIKLSKGKYITFLDDDDYFLPDRIEKLVNLLNNNSSIGGAFTSVIFEDKNGIITNLFHAKKNNSFQKMLLSGKGFFGTGSNMFFRKSIVDKIGLFDADFRRHQDFEYMVRFLQVSDILSVDDFSVVKVDFDGINNPNYKVFYETKEKYLNKFKEIINNYDNKSQRSIYISNLYDLYGIASKKEKKDLLKKFNLYGENRINIYLKNFKLSFKKHLKKMVCVKKIHMFLINGGNYRLLLFNLKNELENKKFI